MIYLTSLQDEVGVNQHWLSHNENNFVVAPFMMLGASLVLQKFQSGAEGQEDS